MAAPLIGRRLLAGTVALALLAACSGGGGGTAVPSRLAPSSGTPVVANATTRVNLKIPAGLKPAYVSPSTLGVTVAAYGVSATPPPTVQAFDLSSGSSLCSTTPPGGSTPDPSGARYCTLPISAPIGSDYVAVSAYDRAPVSGAIPVGAHVLSGGTTRVTIVANVSNAISLSLGGVTSAIAISPPSVNVPAGSTTPITFTIQALDAQNNTILGPTALSNPIVLTLSDNCALFKFDAKSPCTPPSQYSLTVPSTNGLNSVVIDPLGGTVTSAVTLSASTTTSLGTATASASLQAGTATVQPSPIVVPNYSTGGIALGTGSSVDFYASGYSVPPTASPGPVFPTPTPAPSGTPNPPTTPSPVPSAPGTLASLYYGNGITAAQVAFWTDSGGTTWTYVADADTSNGNNGGGVVEIYSPSDILSNNPSYVIDSSSFCVGGGGQVDGVAVDSYGNVYVANVGQNVYCGGGYHLSKAALGRRVLATLHARKPAGHVHPLVGSAGSAIDVFRPSTYQSGGPYSTYQGAADWILTGSDTQLDEPGQIAVDANNNLLVTNYLSDQVTIYGVAASGDALPLTVFSQPGSVSGNLVGLVTTTNGALASYDGSGAVSGFTYDLNGNTTNTYNFVTANSGVPPMAPRNAAVDSAGNLVGWNYDITLPNPSGQQGVFEIIDYAPNFATVLGSGGTPTEFGIMAYPQQNDLFSVAAVPSSLISALETIQGGASLKRRPK